MPIPKCKCGCANPATFTSGGEYFFKRPCRQRFYRHTIRAAQRGDASAQAYVKAQGWNPNANIGGGAPKPPKASPAPQPSPKTTAPKSAPTPRVPQAKAPKAPRVPKTAKVMSDFLASRCKSLTLAAKVLGVKPRPPLVKSIIRAAWISLISVHHPDRGGSLESAQAVNAAYQLLQKFSV